MTLHPGRICCPKTQGKLGIVGRPLWRWFQRTHWNGQVIISIFRLIVYTILQLGDWVVNGQWWTNTKNTKTWELEAKSGDTYHNHTRELARNGRNRWGVSVGSRLNLLCVIPVRALGPTEWGGKMVPPIPVANPLRPKIGRISSWGTRSMSWSAENHWHPCHVKIWQNLCVLWWDPSCKGDLHQKSRCNISKIHCCTLFLTTVFHQSATNRFLAIIITTLFPW